MITLRVIRQFLAGSVFSFVAFLAVPFTAAQGVPSATNYQGRLTDANGVAAPDGGGYEIEVRLWNAGVGGTLLWGWRYPAVVVKSGALNLILGSSTGSTISGSQTTDLDAAFANPSVFVAMTVTKNSTGTPIANPTEILPRQQWLTTPFSFHANTATSVLPGGVNSAAIANGEVKTVNLADGAVQTGKLADGSVTAGKIAVGAITGAVIPTGSIPIDRLSPEYAVFEDRAPIGAAGAGFAAGWNTRSLGATQVISGLSISRGSNSSTLVIKPGTYFVDAECPAYQAYGNQAVLLDVTNPAAPTSAVLGSCDYGRITNASGAPVTHSTVKGYFTVTGSDHTFEIRHYYSGATSGPPAVSSGYGEVYFRIHILRVQ